FPVDVGISEVRGIIEVVKDNGNSLSISKLSEEAEEEIDKLLPLIDACEMLGLCTVENGMVKLTKTGIDLNMKNSSQIISKALSGIEPFRSIKEALAGKALTTSALASILKSKNIVLFADDTVNIEMLRNLLIKWGVRTKMLSYDRDEDKWSLTR
ncbi:MAG: AAA-associated domain-containing protein, partial [Candidatus Micrarchaeia archaeon]